jgi:hypothetical protein
LIQAHAVVQGTIAGRAGGHKMLSQRPFGMQGRSDTRRNRQSSSGKEITLKNRPVKTDGFMMRGAGKST